MYGRRQVVHWGRLWTALENEGFPVYTAECAAWDGRRGTADAVVSSRCLDALRRSGLRLDDVDSLAALVVAAFRMGKASAGPELADPPAPRPSIRGTG